MPASFDLYTAAQRLSISMLCVMMSAMGALGSQEATLESLFRRPGKDL